MNTPVNFEIAKLLKEKGFSLPTYKSYRISVNPELLISKEPITDKNTYFPNVKESYPAPTIAEVVMWLYEKHGMWVDVSLNQFSKPRDLQWMYSIVFIENCTYSHSPKSYNSPTEAYEAAIEYILVNIK